MQKKNQKYKHTSTQMKIAEKLQLYMEATTLQSEGNNGTTNEDEAEQRAREEGAKLEEDPNFILFQDNPEWSKKLQECYILKYSKKGKRAKKTNQSQVETRRSMRLNKESVKNPNVTPNLKCQSSQFEKREGIHFTI